MENAWQIKSDELSKTVYANMRAELYCTSKETGSRPWKLFKLVCYIDTKLQWENGNQ